MILTDAAVYATQTQPLQLQLAQYLKEAPNNLIEGTLISVVVPDCNRLSGATVSAAVYNTLKGRQFDTVVVLSSSHTESFGKLNICNLSHYNSPLGEIEIDDHSRTELCDEEDDIFVGNLGHFHSDGIDVQLPWLQTVLADGFKLLPIVIGQDDAILCKELGDALSEVMYGRRTLIVATADLINADHRTLEKFQSAFESLNLLAMTACLQDVDCQIQGKGAVLAALYAAQKRGADAAKTLKLIPPSDSQKGYIGGIIWRS